MIEQKTCIPSQILVIFSLANKPDDPIIIEKQRKKRIQTKRKHWNLKLKKSKQLGLEILYYTI